MDMRVDLSPDEIHLLIEAVEHYDAYLRCEHREGHAYDELLKALRSLLRK